MQMYGQDLFHVYEDLRKLGMTESDRQFSRWLGCGNEFLRDHRRAAGYARVTPRTAVRLRRQLAELARRLPPGLRREVEAISARLERDAAFAAMLAR